MNLDVLGGFTGEAGGQDFSSISTDDWRLGSALNEWMVDASVDGLKTDKEFSQFFDELINHVVREDFLASVPYIELETGKDLKWRYSSAYQKAIRRSDSSAFHAGLALHACDPDYYWRRTPTIAVEDLAMGDPLVCGLVMHACRFKKVRDRLGAQNLIALLTALMMAATKSRTTCDLTCLPMLHPDARKLRLEADMVDPMTLLECYYSDSEALLPRMVAGHGLGGPRWGAEWYHEPQPQMLLELQKAMCPPLVSWLAERYASHAKDFMWIAYPLEFQMVHSSQEVKHVYNKMMPERNLVGGVLDAAFDGHVAEGRRALAYFSKACPPIREFFEKYSRLDKGACLGMTMFNIDSAVLSDFNVFDGRYAVEDENIRGEYLGKGMTWEQYSELVGLIQDNREMLLKSRKRIVEP